MQHEYMSGGIDMSTMNVYWLGKTAVADFGGYRLERTYPEEGWQLVDVPPATTSPAATQSVTQH
jgi:hypothetical protein